MSLRPNPEAAKAAWSAAWQQTIGIKMKFSPKQIADFHAYERVRLSGKHNMFDRAAINKSQLTSTDYFFVMSNFSALKEAATSPAATAPEWRKKHEIIEHKETL